MRKNADQMQIVNKFIKIQNKKKLTKIAKFDLTENGVKPKNKRDLKIISKNHQVQA